MSKKNEIIITFIEFEVNNFEGAGQDYEVRCYPNDLSEDDTYNIEIFKLEEDDKNIVANFCVDSCGGMTEDFKLDRISQYVCDVLFKVDKQSIIKWF